jgi:hypothetical protein
MIRKPDDKNLQRNTEAKRKKGEKKTTTKYSTPNRVDEAKRIHPK